MDYFLHSVPDLDNFMAWKQERDFGARVNEIESLLSNEQHRLKRRRGRDSSPSGALSYYVSQLAYTEFKIFEQLALPAFFERLFSPFPGAVNAAQTSFVIPSMGIAGNPKTLGDGGEVPYVDVTFDLDEYKLYMETIGYRYTLETLAEAEFLNIPFAQKTAETTVNAYKRRIQDFLLHGDPKRGVDGFFNLSQITPVPAAAPWVADSPYNVVKDVMQKATTLVRGAAYSKFNLKLLVDYDAYDALNLPTNSLAAATGEGFIGATTVIEFIEKNVSNKLSKEAALLGVPSSFEVIACPSLETAASDGSGRAILYVDDPMFLGYFIPKPLQFQAPQFVDLWVKVPGSFKFSSVVAPYPQVIMYIDGVSNVTALPEPAALATESGDALSAENGDTIGVEDGLGASVSFVAKSKGK